MSFFPDEIQTESISKYIGPSKLGQGETRFRLLEDPIFFYETWVEKSPKRFALTEEIPMDEIGPDGLKQVMATKAYNYDTKAIQILSISQKTILKPLKKYSDNPKYGHPNKYDILIEKTGEGKNSRYGLTADPKEKINKEVKKADKETVVELEQLMINADPFLKNAPTADTVDKDLIKDDDLNF